MRDHLVKCLYSLLAIVAAVLAYTYWPEQAQVFDRPIGDVRSILQVVGLPPHVFGSVPKKVKVLNPSQGTMVWSISEDEREDMRYVVTLVSEGPSATRVTVDVTGRPGTPIADKGSLAIRFRAVRNIYITAMKEQIASALERRDFQTYKIVPPSAIAVLVNMATLSSWLSGGDSSPRRAI